MSIVSRWIVVSLILALVVRVVTLHVLGYQPHRSIITDIFQGLIAGGVLGCFTVEIFAWIKTTTVNGWITLPLLVLYRRKRYAYIQSIS
jgi:hypothetical protein